MSLILDGTSGVTFPNSTVQASAGQVLQVVNATYSTTVSNATSTFVDTGLTATITPKFATSKILVLVNQNGVGHNASNTYLFLALLRNSTIICSFEKTFGYVASALTFYAATGTNYLDSPATTSAVTYKTQFNNQNTGIAYCQNYGTETSTITLMEIAG